MESGLSARQNPRINQPASSVGSPIRKNRDNAMSQNVRMRDVFVDVRELGPAQVELAR